MSRKTGSLKAGLQRGQAELDELPSGAIIIDQHGAAWQFGGIYWYRAFDSDQPVSSFELAQFGEFRVLEGGAS